MWAIASGEPWELKVTFFEKKKKKQRESVQKAKRRLLGFHMHFLSSFFARVISFFLSSFLLSFASFLPYFWWVEGI